MFLSTIDLASLNGVGVRVTGAFALDEFGQSVAGAGDVNGDGFDDLIMGASEASNTAFESGSSYVLLGGRTLPADAAVSAVPGLRIDGEARLDTSGLDVAGAGDVDGDGLSDVLIGAPLTNRGFDTDAGTAYLVRGTGATATVDLSVLGPRGARLLGEADDDVLTGYSVAGIGDVNGDGLDDIAVGATFADVNGVFNGGGLYVVFGRRSGFRSDLDLEALDGTDGFAIGGEKIGARQGFTVAAAGDVNGDGIDDFVFGTPYADVGGRSNAGTAYVVFGARGPSRPIFQTEALDGTNGFRMLGQSTGDFAAADVSGGGDVNGDGFNDLVVSAPGLDLNGDRSGGAYVVFGGRTAPATVRLGALNGSDGFRVLGERAGDNAGRAVAIAGDLDGDGLADVAIGSPGSNRGGVDSGAVHVVYGSDARFPADVELAGLSGTRGFRIDGAAAGDAAGAAVAAAGDPNGDGRDDLLIGAPLADGGANDTGAAYIVLGRGEPTSPPAGGIVRTGGPGPDRLVGTGFADTLKGAAGNDALFGGGGNDRLLGGAGNDVLDGGAGRDVLAGQGGVDTVSYASGGAVRADLAVARTNTGAAAGDVYGSIENLTGSRAGDVLLGNGLGNTIRGGTGFDVLIGRGGNDVLLGGAQNDFLGGGAGNDTLGGGAGNDRINGGTGRDVIYGGAGRDTFVFTSAIDAARGDVIADFRSGGPQADVLDLRIIDANATLGGNQAFRVVASLSGVAGEVQLLQRGGATIVRGDVDGGGVDFAIQLNGTFGANAIDAGDLVL